MQEDNNNPYEPPSSSVEVDTKDPVEGFYFSTSTTKLVLLSTCSLGFYELFWFYYNWALIKERWEPTIMPFWRALFAPLWAYSCFRHIRDSAMEHKIADSFPIVPLAIIYFLLGALWRLPDPYWLVSFLSPLILIPANTIALKVNLQVDPNFENNASFSVWNWIVIALGGSIIALGLIGTFVSA